MSIARDVYVMSAWGWSPTDIACKWLLEVLFLQWWELLLPLCGHYSQHISNRKNQLINSYFKCHTYFICQVMFSENESTVWHCSSPTLLSCLVFLALFSPLLGSPIPCVLQSLSLLLLLLTWCVSGEAMCFFWYTVIHRLQHVLGFRLSQLDPTLPRG